MTGTELKETGQELVEIHNTTFCFTMRQLAVAIAKQNGGYVTVDDLRERAAKEGIAPRHPNAWGAVFGKAPTGYRFKNTRAYQQSRIPTNRARVIPIWAVERKAA